MTGLAAASWVSWPLRPIVENTDASVLARLYPEVQMSTQTAPELLLRELLAWVADRPRTYAETIEAWRSNCPRHPVLDDAFTDDLIHRAGGFVVLTASGREALR